MKKIIHIVVILILVGNPLIITQVINKTLVQVTLAQSDGGDGISGAGSDNQSYDSGPTDSGPSESDQTQSTPSDTGPGDPGPDGSNSVSSEVTQDQVDAAQSEQTAAWDNLQTMLSEGLATESELAAAEQSYLAASAYADAIGAEYAAQHEAATAEAASQQSMQDTISGTGITDIQNGATVADVAAQHLDPSLSPDRAAAVMGQWTAEYASIHGIDPVEAARSPEFQAAWGSYVAGAVSAGTIGAEQAAGALAGGMGIATQTAGGTVEQMAEAAGQTGGLAAYTATINSIPGQLSAETVAQNIAEYGARNGYTVEQVAAAQRTAGVDPSTAHAATQSAFGAAAQSRGEEPFTQGITHSFNNGWSSGAVPTATANGIPSGAPSISAGTAPAGGSPVSPAAAAGTPGSSAGSLSDSERSQVVASLGGITTPGGVTDDVAGSRLEAIGRTAQERGLSPAETLSLVNEAKTQGLLGPETGFATNEISKNLNQGFYGTATPSPQQTAGLTGPNGETRSLGDLVNQGYSGRSMGPASTNPTPGSVSQPGATTPSGPAPAGTQPAAAAPGVENGTLSVNGMNFSIPAGTYSRTANSPASLSLPTEVAAGSSISTGEMKFDIPNGGGTFTVSIQAYQGANPGLETATASISVTPPGGTTQSHSLTAPAGTTVQQINETFADVTSPSDFASKAAEKGWTYKQ